MKDLALELKGELKKEKINKVVIVYHGDADGILSAVILKILLEEFFNTNEFLFIPQNKSPYILDNEILKKIIEYCPDVIFTLDLPTHRYKKSLEELSYKTESKIFIIDHHLPFEEESKENIHFYNTTPFPPSYFMYYLYTYLFEGKRDLSWISILGVFIDDKERLCKDLYELVKNVYPGYYVVLGKFASMFTSLRIFLDNTPNIAINILLDSKNPCNLLIDRRIIELHMKLEKAYAKINNIIKNIEKTSELYFNNKLLFCRIDNSPNLAVEPLVASNLIKKYSNSIVLVFSKRENNVVFEIRVGKNLNKNLDITKVLESSSNGIPNAFVGGHPMAGGGCIPRDSWNEFKENLIKEMEKEFL